MAESLPLLLAIFTASLAGSGHCIGMCGPFAVIACGSCPTASQSRFTGLLGYHLGRAMTYCVLGVTAGLLGSWFNWGATLFGWQRFAAWVTGGLMLGCGLFTIIGTLTSNQFALRVPQSVQRVLRAAYRHIAHLPAWLRPLAVGTITGWLPCGWLYVFVLLAVGTANPWLGGATMIAFWLGTIPALTVVAVGFHGISTAWRGLPPYATACLLIVGGLFTLSARADAQLEELPHSESEKNTTIESVEMVEQTPLPCCSKLNSAKRDCCAPPATQPTDIATP